MYIERKVPSELLTLLLSQKKIKRKNYVYFNDILFYYLTRKYVVFPHMYVTHFLTLMLR